LDHEFKANIQEGKEGKAIYDYGGYLPYFGNGSDLYIDPGCLGNTESYSYLGKTYEKPSPDLCKNVKKFLAGTEYFQVQELEIYQVPGERSIFK